MSNVSTEVQARVAEFISQIVIDGLQVKLERIEGGCATISFHLIDNKAMPIINIGETRLRVDDSVTMTGIERCLNVEFR